MSTQIQFEEENFNNRRSKPPEGIQGWLINTKIVKNKKSANQLLLVVFFILVIGISSFWMNKIAVDNVEIPVIDAI